MALVSTIALFADIESTGNLSMALNGAGIVQSAIFFALIYLYKTIYFDKNSYIYIFNKGEKIFLSLTSMVSAVP